MNLNKSSELFKPSDCDGIIHIIGRGSVGSTVAENLARLGLTEIYLYDPDYVASHNIANQMFYEDQVNELKTNALSDTLRRVNPDIENSLETFEEGYLEQMLSGYVFLCLDNIDTRRAIVERNINNPQIKAMFDFRMRATDGQLYAAEWSDKTRIQQFLNTMDFTHEEAMADTPVSACNLTQSVAPAVRFVCSAGVLNFMNFVKRGELKHTILADGLNLTLLTFD